MGSLDWVKDSAAEMYWSSLSVDTEQLYEVTLSKLIGGS
jgi:hypothetical protein